MRFGDLTYLEIRSRAEDGWIAVVTTGCTEQQGPHLSVDFDTWFAEAVALAASERALAEHGVGSLVLPPMPFGPTPEHRNYGSGYVDLPTELHDALVRATLDSLADGGFERMLVWRGCGGHDLGDTVERFNGENGHGARAFLPSWPYGEIWARHADPSVPAGHADSFTTSMAMYLRPDSVRPALIPAPETEPVDWDTPDLDFSRYSPSGVVGDPTHASAELGERLWHDVVESVALSLKEMADTPVPADTENGRSRAKGGPDT